MNEGIFNEEMERKEQEKIETSLNQLIKVDSVNLQAQEIYLDIMKKKRKKIDSNFIKNIYKLFSENKANEIWFQKECRNGNELIRDKCLTRYYLRLLQIGMKKIAYYWMNAKFLEFLSMSILSFSKQMESCIRKIIEIQTLESHVEFIKLYYKENILLEEKIYNLLIDRGYLSSMDEYYRINGIGSAHNQIYETKRESQEQSKKVLEEFSSKTIEITQIQKEDLIPLKIIAHKERLIYRKRTPRSSIRRSAFVKRYEDPDANNKKIKRIFDDIIPSLKTALISNRADLFKNQRRSSFKNSAINQLNMIFNPNKHEKLQKNSGGKRISKNQSIVSLQIGFSQSLIEFLESSQNLTIEKVSELMIAIDHKSKREKVQARIKKKQRLTPKHQISRMIPLLKGRETPKQVHDFQDFYMKDFINESKTLLKRSKKFPLNPLQETNAIKNIKKRRNQVTQHTRYSQINKKIFENQAILRELNLQNELNICHQLLFSSKKNNSCNTTSKVKTRCEGRKTLNESRNMNFSHSDIQTGTKYVVYDCRQRNIIKP